MISIQEATWENFLGYGNYTSKINFDDYKGVCLIEGEHDDNINREEGDEKLNASGKTSIVEVLIWCLFGKLSRKDRPGDDVVNWHTGKNCKAKIKTHDGYEIVRFRKHSDLGNEVLVFKDGNDITRSTSKPVQEFINETFNIDYDTFVRTRIFTQFSCGFMELTETQMRKVLEKLTYVDNLTPISQTAKAKSDGISKEIDILKSEVDNIELSINSIEETISDIRNQDKNFLDDKQIKIQKVRDKLISSKKDLDEEISEIEDDIADKKKNKKELDEYVNVSKLAEEWNVYNESKVEKEKLQGEESSIKDKISKKSNSLEILENKISNINISDKYDIELIKENAEKFNNNKLKIKKYQDKIKSCNNYVSQSSLMIDQENSFINDDELDESTCGKCKQSVSKEYIENERHNSLKKIEKLQQIITINEDKIDDFNSKISKLETENENLEIIDIDVAEKHNNKIDELTKLLNELNDKKTDIELELESLNKDLSKIQSDISKISLNKPSMTVSEAESNNKYLDSVDDNINKLNKSIIKLKEKFKLHIMDCNKDIQEIQKEESPFKTILNEENKKLLKEREKKTGKQKELDQKKLLKAHVDYIKESYGNKKKIKAWRISKLTPEINSNIKYYLDHFESKDSIEFNEYLSAKMDRWSYTTHSGGECKRIDLSMMFGFSDVHTNNFGPQSNFMILDEVDGRIDPFTINKLCSLLSDDILNRNDGLTNIFIISHRSEMKDRFPHKIRVKNNEERAYIQNE